MKKYFVEWAYSVGEYGMKLDHLSPLIIDLIYRQLEIHYVEKEVLKLARKEYPHIEMDHVHIKSMTAL